MPPNKTDEVLLVLMEQGIWGRKKGRDGISGLDGDMTAITVYLFNEFCFCLFIGFKLPFSLASSIRTHVWVLLYYLLCISFN